MLYNDGMINERYENAVQNLAVADLIVSNATSIAESMNGEKVSDIVSQHLAQMTMKLLAKAQQVKSLLNDIRDGKL
jgi:transcriptional regulator NrdR family protein